MKKILIINGLILSSLTLSAQNWVNNDDNVYASNVQVNYSSSLTNVSVQTNVSNSNINIQSVNRGGRGNASALSNLNVSNGNKNEIQVQTQTTNKPKQKKTVQVQANTNPVVNEGNFNEGNRGGNLWVNDNVGNSNPQVNNTHKTVATKPIVMEEFKGTDFKPISLSGRDYSNGGKMKKGFKNFPKADHSKVKHKKKPVYKKVKYRTSNCASW